MHLFREEVFQQECGLILLVLFKSGMSPFPVSRIRSKVKWNVRVMSTTPGKVIGDAVMGSRMEQHVNIALPQLLQVAGYKDFISNLCREFSEF